MSPSSLELNNSEARVRESLFLWGRCVGPQCGLSYLRTFPLVKDTVDFQGPFSFFFLSHQTKRYYFYYYKFYYYSTIIFFRKKSFAKCWNSRELYTKTYFRRNYLARKCVNYNYNTVYDRVSRNEISRFLHEVICAICVCTKLDCEWGKIKRENTLVKLKKRSGCKHKRLDKFDKESDWKISLKRIRARGISNLHCLHLTSNHLQLLPRSTWVASKLKIENLEINISGQRNWT